MDRLQKAQRLSSPRLIPGGPATILIAYCTRSHTAVPLICHDGKLENAMQDVHCTPQPLFRDYFVGAEHIQLTAEFFEVNILAQNKVSAKVDGVVAAEVMLDPPAAARRLKHLHFIRLARRGGGKLSIDALDQCPL